jgi:hypothetical protein
VSVKILDEESHEVHEVAPGVRVVPAPTDVNPDRPRGRALRTDGDVVELSYTPMGPEGSVGLSRLTLADVSTFRAGEPLFVESEESDRLGRRIWRLGRVVL